MAAMRADTMPTTVVSFICNGQERYKKHLPDFEKISGIVIALSIVGAVPLKIGTEHISVKHTLHSERACMFTSIVLDCSYQRGQPAVLRIM